MDKTGGAAFPGGAVQDSDFERTFQAPYESGMTLLDYFAGQALQGYLSGPMYPDNITKELDDETRAKRYAEVSYAFAAAMLSEKARREGGK